MFEIFKLMWDAIVLRDAARKGQLRVRMFVMAFVWVIALYAVALPPVMLYQNNPAYKPLFIAALVVDGFLFIAMMAWAIKWRRKMLEAQAAEEANGPQGQ